MLEGLIEIFMRPIGLVLRGVMAIVAQGPVRGSLIAVALLLALWLLVRILQQIGERKVNRKASRSRTRVDRKALRDMRRTRMGRGVDR
ncbi:hypothetical protein [Roseobacter sp. HKCCA0434]|uniref:hypothetical protein n=1 Tax=Roseobacter sp. HKCCA0434 TaxID=3079297 RepID=UPI002905DA16|nr:hypothetical protein [Roseobacter sp. HKCCA0434]